VALVASLLISLLALGTVLLSTFTEIQEFSTLSARERFVSPVAQCLGALYASFISLPMLAGARGQRLGREIVALGSIVFMLGVLISLICAAAGVLGAGWFGLKIALTVLLIGAVTWIVPFLIAMLQAKQAGAAMEAHLQAMLERKER
jgi:hypothetical protein